MDHSLIPYVKYCGKTFCHNILPQKNRRNFVQNFVEISSNLSWSNEIFDELSTKFSRSFFVAKGVAKWIATRIATKSSTKALTNSQRPTDVIPFLLQIMSSTNTIYTCTYIRNYIYIYIHTQPIICGISSTYTMWYIFINLHSYRIYVCVCTMHALTFREAPE